MKRDRAGAPPRGAFVIAALTAICVSCSDASDSPNASGGPTQGSPFAVEEILANPTETTVQLSVYPRGAAAVFVEYWEGDNGPRRRSEVQRSALEPRAALVFELEGLQPDREYQYRVVWQGEGGQPVQRPTGSVRTLRRAEDASFRFAYAIWRQG